jgi:hypothetical protein
MKGLTIWRPWSLAIAEGWKPVENRGWATTYRSLVAIHGGQRWDPAAVVMIGELAGWHVRLEQAPAGAVVAVARLADICIAAMTGGVCSCGPWAMPEQCHWRFSEVRKLSEPVPCCGAQGLWTVPAAVEAQILERAA